MITHTHPTNSPTRLLALALSLALSLVLQAEPNAPQSERIYQAAAYGILPDRPLEASRLQRLLDTIKHAHQPGQTSRLVLVPGAYHLTEGSYAHRRLYISNHDQIDSLRPVGLDLEGMQDFVLDASGAVLTFSGRMLPIAVRSSRRVVLRGLEIRFATPLMQDAEILENRGTEGLTFATGRPLTEYQGQYYIGDPRRGQGVAPNAGLTFDGKGRQPDGVALLVPQLADLGVNLRRLEIRSSAPGHYVYHAPLWQDDRLTPGMIIAMRNYERPNPAIFIDESTDTRLEDVTIRYAEGMGILAQNSHNLHLEGIVVAPWGAVHSTSADATHFSGCSGHIEVRRSHFEAMMDDAINVHGRYLALDDRKDDYTLVASYRHDQAWGMRWGKVGDTIQLVVGRTLDVLPETYTIASIRPTDSPTEVGARQFEIRLRERLKPDIRPERGIGLENLTMTPSVTFDSNTIYNNRARGTLINTPRMATITNNRFREISGSAILTSSDCNMWWESGRTRQLLIRGNVFENCLKSLYQFTEGIISFCPVIPEVEHQRTPFYGDGGAGITIEDNTFYTFDLPLLYTMSVDGVLWRRNTIIQTDAYAPFHPRAERYPSGYSRRVIIQE